MQLCCQAVSTKITEALQDDKTIDTMDCTYIDMLSYIHGTAANHVTPDLKFTAVRLLLVVT